VNFILLKPIYIYAFVGVLPKCFPGLSPLFCSYFVAFYALCRHFFTLPNSPSCLPFTSGETVGSATVHFSYSSKLSFFLGGGVSLGVLKHVWVSATVRRGVLLVLPRLRCFSVFCVLICGQAMRWLCCVSCDLGTVLSLSVYTADFCGCKVTLLYICASVGRKVSVPIAILYGCLITFAIKPTRCSYF